MDENSNNWLLKAWCRGDRSAFDALYRRYVRKVWGTAWRMTGSVEDAEDVVQEVFLKLAQKAAKIRNGTAVSTWIYQVTVNAATDCLRKRKDNRTLDMEGDPITAEVVVMESLHREVLRREALERDAMLERVAAMLPGLPEGQSAVFVLRGFQGLSHREIAEILGISESNSKTRFSLACSRLRERIAAEEASRDDSNMLNGSGEVTS